MDPAREKDNGAISPKSHENKKKLKSQYRRIKHAEIVVTAATENTQSLAHTCRAICEKKDQAWQNKWEIKGISQSIMIY